MQFKGLYAAGSKTGKDNRCLAFTSSINVKLEILTSWSCLDSKELNKNGDACEEFVFCSLNLFLSLFWRFRCHRHTGIQFNNV